MGLPDINITFRTAAAETISQGARGTVGLILRDSAGPEGLGGFELTDEQQIPVSLGESNKKQIQNALIGYVNRPRKLLAYVLGEEDGLDQALAWFNLHMPDYLAGPPDCTQSEAQSIAAWVKARRLEHKTPKAVLPNLPADNEAVINFVTGGIRAGGQVYTAAQYCGRIAGLIAGTPLTIACTFAPLSEVEDVERLTTEQMDQAVEEGKFFLFHDGKKVKCSRGVNSLVTTVQGKGAAFQKIKILEAIDRIQADLRLSIQDSYIGKYANSYDNKCLLIAAIKGYLESLELEGVLKEGSVKNSSMGQRIKARLIISISSSRPNRPSSDFAFEANRS